jgi:hypothetical protein
MRDMPQSQMPRDHVRQEPASSRSYLGTYLSLSSCSYLGS